MMRHSGDGDIAAASCPLPPASSPAIPKRPPRTIWAEIDPATASHVEEQLKVRDLKTAGADWLTASGGLDLRRESEHEGRSYPLLAGQQCERWQKQVRLDVTRTFAAFPTLQPRERALTRMLTAACNLMPACGYTQGMNFVAVLFIAEYCRDDDDAAADAPGEGEHCAFWSFAGLLRNFAFDALYGDEFVLRAYAIVGIGSVLERLPALRQHFADQAFPIGLQAVEWFTSCCATCVSLPLALACMDLLLLGVDDVGPRLGTALLALLEKELLAMPLEQLMRQFKALLRAAPSVPALRRLLSERGDVNTLCMLRDQLASDGSARPFRWHLEIRVPRAVARQHADLYELHAIVQNMARKFCAGERSCLRVWRDSTTLKRFSSLHRLHKQLAAAQPGVRLPPFPAKQMFGARSADVVSRRRLQLQTFFAALSDTEIDAVPRDTEDTESDVAGQSSPAHGTRKYGVLDSSILDKIAAPSIHDHRCQCARRPGKKSRGGAGTNNNAIASAGAGGYTGSNGGIGRVQSQTQRSWLRGAIGKASKAGETAKSAGIAAGAGQRTAKTGGTSASASASSSDGGTDTAPLEAGEAGANSRPSYSGSPASRGEVGSTVESMSDNAASQAAIAAARAAATVYPLSHSFFAGDGLQTLTCTDVKRLVHAALAVQRRSHVMRFLDSPPD